MMGALMSLIAGVLLGGVLGYGLRDARARRESTMSLSQLQEYRAKSSRVAKRVAQRNASQMFGSLEGRR